MIKNCFSCKYYPNDTHCHGCGWDGSKNKKWESAKILRADVLDKVRSDVINIADGKQSIKVRSVLRIIDKYREE